MKKALLALLLLVAPAWAQMDPRNASGIPRPDEQVPVGELTVLVLHGEMNKHADAGVPVTLVGLMPDGKITKTLQATDATGHAVFDGLRTDGQAVYYAFCLLDGDRLESDGVIPDGTSGVRLLLAGRKLDASGKPTGDPIDDERRDDDGNTPPAPAGQVFLVLRGRMDKSLDVVLKEVGTDAIVARTQATATGTSQEIDKLIGVFDHIPTGPDHAYYGEAQVGGRTFRTHPLVLSETTGVTRGVLVVDQLLFSMQGGAELEDDRLGFQLQLNLLNATGVPWDTGPGGVVIPLPSGFTSANVKDESFGDRVSVVPGEGVRVTGVIPPGSHNTIATFALPQKDGVVDFEMALPLGIYDSQVAIEKAAGAQIAPSVHLAAPKVSRSDDGREFYLVGNLELQPGQVLGFQVTGLPEPSRVEQVARVGAGVIVLGLVVWGLAIILAPVPAPAAKPAQKKKDRGTLEAHRDRLYEQLVDLENRGVAGDEREKVVSWLVRVLRDLDEVGLSPSKKTRRAS